MLINSSSNHLTATPLAAQGEHLKHYLMMLYYHSATNNIKHCKRSVSKLHEKAKYFKIKAYRIYSNKRRIWDKKVNKRRTADAALIRGISYNREKHYKLFQNDKGVRSHS